MDVDRYQLEDELARSWSGEVWRAVDTRSDRRVVVRRFSFAQPAPLVRRTRFLRQLELLIQAPAHPHVLRVFDAGVDQDGCPYVVTELLEDAAPEPVPAGGAPIERVLRVGAAVTRALSHLHDLGVVHQALATDAVLRSGPQKLKLTGFGLACLEDLGRLLEATARDDGPRDPARRFCYLAPEQAGLRRAVGPATDLYALGVVLHELLTGRPPFDDPDPGAVLHGHLARTPPAVTEARPETPPALAELTAALLAKEPAQRPTGEEVLVRLRRLQDDAPDEADVPAADASALNWAVPLVAREGELLALTAALGEARQGQGRSALISGGAGRGKSRLIETLRERAVEAGGRLIVGKCLEGIRPRPLDPFATAVADYQAQLRKLPRADRVPRETVCRERCPEVLTAAFARAGAPTPLLPGGHDSRSDQFERCVEFLLALAAVEPVLVLAIDDLQWADEGTLQLFANLSQAARGSSLLVVGACRPDELDAHTGEVLARLRGSEAPPLDLELGPLAPGDAAQLVVCHLGREDEPPPTEVAAAIVHVVGGNPLHLRQSLQALVEQGGLRREASGWVLDPAALDGAALRAGVTEVIRVRAERLGEEVCAALSRAAVIGRSFSLDLLVDISELRPSHALRALERGQAAGLLEEEQGRLVWNFTHDKVREALYALVPPGDLVGLHRAIADAVRAEAAEALPDHAAELAYHYTQAGQIRQALRFHMLAGERAQAAFVLHAAGEHFAWCLAHLDPEEEPLPFARAVALYSSARRYAGDTARNRALLERALPIAIAHDDLQLEVELTGRLAMVSELAKSPDAVEWIRRFGDVAARSGEPRAGVIAQAMLGYHLFERGDARRAIPELEACIDASAGVADEGLDAAEVANLSAVLGYAYARAGQFDEGVRRIEAAIESAERIGRSVVGWTTTALGALYLEWGMWEEGLPHHARARRILEETGDAFYLYLARATAGLGRVLAGDPDEGLRRLDAALDFGESRGIRSYRCALTCFGGEAELMIGRAAAGEHRVRHALTDARASGDRWTECRAQRVLAEWVADRPEAVEADLESAEQEARTALRTAEELGLRPEVGRVQRALGKILARRGRGAEARAAFAAARAELEACRMELDLALVPADDGGDPVAPATSEPASSPTHDLLHRRGFQTVVRVSRMVGATLDLDVLLDRALGAVVEVFGAERGFVLLDEGQGLAVRAARGNDTGSLDAAARAVIDRVRRGDAVTPGDLGHRSWLCAPIGAPPARAVIYLENRLVSDLLGGDDALVLQAIAAQLAVGIESANTYREVARLKERLEQENVYLKEELASHAFPEIVGESAALRRALRRVEQVAPTDATVLLRGETGTGKELFARAIHDHSARARGPLVRVNCSALPATLVASELFGHEKGAFTGATAQRPGRFELARGGTLFLDEIGDVPLETQAALLRVLEEGEFERVGGTRTLRSDVRVVAATNRDLEAAVESGEFRRDLLYRLNGFTLAIPPLRERREDIPLLAQSFALAHARTLGKTIRELAPEALSTLQAADWPGNVRELKGVIERAVILAAGPVLTLELFPTALEEPPPAAADDLAELVSLEEHERRYLRRVLDATGWVIKGERGAARILGVPPSTLTSRLKKLGLRRPARRGTRSR